MAHYLICYDIANPKRLGRVHRKVIKHALFIQFSVYYLQGNRRELDALLSDLQDVIDESYDDIRVYPVEPLSNSWQIGVSWLPEEVGLFY